LVKSGTAKSIADAQFKVARLYGFASWPKLKAHVDSLEEIGQLKHAIDTNDFPRVRDLLSRNPTLHRAPLGYGKNGPLTWVAECRVPWEPPGRTRLAIARWMLENGSDVHQGGDGPLMRACLNGDRIPMMELLVSYGANVNAVWSGYYPIIFAPCETVDPAVLKWLLDHGANPNCANPERQRYTGTALDQVIRSYWRSPHLGICIEMLLDVGATTKYDPLVLDLLRGRLDSLRAQLDADTGLVNERFSALDFGRTAHRRVTLQGATLLHLAAEYGNLEAVKVLLKYGAQVNTPAAVDGTGVGGQTAIFHAVTQFGDWGLPVAELLVERGADLTVRAKLPGHLKSPDEVLECTPLGYAVLFPGEPQQSKSVAFLRSRGAVE
jgi:ankyrin repeat protein